MQLRYPVLGVLAVACLTASLVGCSRDDRIDRVIEQQEQILKELHDLGSAYRSLVNRGLMVVPEQAMQNKRGKFLGWRQGAGNGTPKADDSPRKGPDDAKVTVIEFADFECPYCTALAGIGDELVAEYPDQVQFVFKHFPIGRHPNAIDAARAAWAAQQQGKFWQMHDLLFRTKDLSPDGLEAHAKELGLDVERFNRDRSSPAARGAISFDRIRGRAAGVDGTPTFFVGGKKVQATSKEVVKLAVASALEEGKSDATAEVPSANPLP